MLWLLSPAKSLDETTPVPPGVAKLALRPSNVDRSHELIRLLRQQSPQQLARLMGVSPALAELNVGRYAQWRPSFGARESRPAVWMFDGDVYGGLGAKSLSVADLAWAQSHLAILSGLHGMLRPLDRIRPYRLEMGTRLANPRGADLYRFWDRTVAERIDAMVARHPVPVVVNLASVEYFGVVERSSQPLRARVIHCVFEERIDRNEKGGDDAADGVSPAPDEPSASSPAAADADVGRADPARTGPRPDPADRAGGRGADDSGYRIVAFHAKRARGLMARHAILNRVGTPEGLRSFTAENYRYDAAASTLDRYVFRRPRPPSAAVERAA